MIKILTAFVFICSQIASLTAFADIYDDAIANSARSENDKQLDSKRKPAEVLRFFEISKNMNVLDVFAGGGYYSEILSNIVGPEGSVALYNNAPWDKYVDKVLIERLKDNRLSNVDRQVDTPESLIDRDEKYDAAIFILGMHDVYYADTKNGWVAIDKAKFLKGIYKTLNAGAVFGVIDANAELGADNEHIGEKYHRVDPQVMIKDIESAGFVLEAESFILRNKNDNLNSSVFLPENRYNTDRSVLKFRKP